MVARRLTAVAIGLASAVVALYLVLGCVVGLDREDERVTVSVALMLTYEAVGVAGLAAAAFAITRAPRVWRGEPVATMVLSFVGALVAGALFFLLLAVAFSS